MRKKQDRGDGDVEGRKTCEQTFSQHALPIAQTDGGYNRWKSCNFTCWVSNARLIVQKECNQIAGPKTNMLHIHMRSQHVGEKTQDTGEGDAKGRKACEYAF